MTLEDNELQVPIALLTSVLTFHVAAGSLDSGVVSSLNPDETLQGESVTVAIDPTDPIGVELDGRANLVGSDFRARNGIIHVIDTELTPAALETLVEPP